jgi:hypothetical protein
MEGLQDDYRAVSGKSLIHSIRAKMESTDLEIAVAYYVRGMGPMIGFVDTRRANANIEIANDYKKITGF